MQWRECKNDGKKTFDNMRLAQMVVTMIYRNHVRRSHQLGSREREGEIRRLCSISRKESRHCKVRQPQSTGRKIYNNFITMHAQRVFQRACSTADLHFPIQLGAFLPTRRVREPLVESRFHDMWHSHILNVSFAFAISIDTFCIRFLFCVFFFFCAGSFLQSANRYKRANRIC